MKSCQQGKKPLDNKDYWPPPHVAYKNVIKLSVRGNIGSAESGRTLHKSKFNCSPVISEYVPEPSLLWIEMECVCVWLAWLLPIHLWVSVDISFSSVQLWVRIRREGSSDLQLSFIFGISSSHRSCGCTRFTQNQWWFHLYLYQPVLSIPDTLLRLTALKNVKSTALVSLLMLLK